jgi:hypothetical protein
MEQVSTDGTSETIQTPQIKMIRFMGRELPRSSVEKALYSSLGFFVVFNAVSIPFALPKLRAFLGAPYLPSSTKSFRTVLDSIPDLKTSGLKLVDVGSGDGRLVLESSRRGFSALGIEMNPWLVFLSRMRLLVTGFYRQSPIIWSNAWMCEDRLVGYAPDVITFYGRPGGGVMNRFGEMAERICDRTDKKILIISNKFKIPGWQMRQIGEINGFYIYRIPHRQ